MTPAEALRKALAVYDDSPTALAAAIGAPVKRQNVEYWISVGYVPAEQCPGVERAVRGIVTCEDLSPADVHWERIRDKSWPWHKRGRPVLDVTKAPA